MPPLFIWVIHQKCHPRSARCAIRILCNDNCDSGASRNTSMLGLLLFGSVSHNLTERYIREGWLADQRSPCIVTWLYACWSSDGGHWVGLWQVVIIQRKRGARLVKPVGESNVAFILSPFHPAHRLRFWPAVGKSRAATPKGLPSRWVGWPCASGPPNSPQFQMRQNVRGHPQGQTDYRAVAACGKSLSPQVLPSPSKR